jgi:hypothetical protein
MLSDLLTIVSLLILGMVPVASLLLVMLDFAAVVVQVKVRLSLLLLMLDFAAVAVVKVRLL